MTEPDRGDQDVLEWVKRSLAGAQSQVTGSVARLVSDPSDDRLDRLLRTPARRVVLDGIFWQMPRFLNRKQAAGVNASIRWFITGRGDGGVDVYNLEIADQRARVTRGEAGMAPRLTMTLDAAEFVRIATGGSDPMQAYFKGRIVIKGDIMFAARLVSLLRTPRARPRRPT